MHSSLPFVLRAHSQTIVYHQKGGKGIDIRTTGKLSPPELCFSPASVESMKSYKYVFSSLVFALSSALGDDACLHARSLDRFLFVDQSQSALCMPYLSEQVCFS
jgi:hypothetical protein